MRKFLLQFVFCFLCVAQVFGQVGPGALIFQDNGSNLGGIKKLNVTPAGSATISGSTGTISLSAGSVAGVTASGPLNSSGGTNPNISLNTPLSVPNGGTSLSVIANAIMLGNGTGSPTAYGGTSCASGTVIRDLNASGSVINCSALPSGGGSVTSVTASGPLNSSGGATPNISIITPMSVANGGTSLSVLTNAILLGNGTGALTAYAGSSCTNQAATSTNASGALSCSSITSAFMSGPVNTVFMGVAGGGASVVVIPPCGDVGGQHLNYASQGLITCGTTSSGGSGSTRVDQLLAASASNSITWNGNIPQVWGMGTTTNNTVAFNMSESIISSGGTTTGGIPNQVLLKLYTNGNSTMSPLSVYMGTAHVFSVDTTNPQIVANSGTNSKPTYSFAAATGDGMSTAGAGSLELNSGGVRVVRFSSGGQILGPSGSATLAAITDLNNSTAGFFFANNIVGTVVALHENWRTIAGALQVSKGTADAVGYALNFRKSRGVVETPTVITTGDYLATIGGWAYVGATNTYVNAASISMLSTGTIADAASGVGGIIQFGTMRAGSDSVIQNNLSIQGGSTGYTTFAPVRFASLPTVGVASGSILFCQDCDAPTLVDSTCTSSAGRVGSIAAFINNLWKCIS